MANEKQYKIREIKVSLEEITKQDIQPSFIEKHLPGYHGEPLVIYLTGRLKEDRAVMWGNLLKILHRQETEKGEQNLIVRIENREEYRKAFEDAKRKKLLGIEGLKLVRPYRMRSSL